MAGRAVDGIQCLKSETGSFLEAGLYFLNSLLLEKTNRNRDQPCRKFGSSDTCGYHLEKIVVHDQLTSIAKITVVVQVDVDDAAIVA